MSGGVTVRDIADAAGVSVGTVSRALKNQRGLSDETRRHVRQVAADLGYDLSRLRSGKAPRLVFLIHRHHSNFAVNPFFAEVMHGVEEGCRQFGVAPTLLSARQGDAVGKLLKLHEPDALLVAGYFEDEVLAQLTDLGLPLVLVDGWIPGCAAVNPDNTGGGYQATRHLLDLGRQRIAYIAGSLAHFSIRERSRGYRRALFEAGVLADPDLEALAPPGLDDAEGAAAAMRTLLRPAGAAGRRVRLQRQRGAGGDAGVPERRAAHPGRHRFCRLRRHPGRPLRRHPAHHAARGQAGTGAHGGGDARGGWGDAAGDGDGGGVDGTGEFGGGCRRGLTAMVLFQIGDDASSW